MKPDRLIGWKLVLAWLVMAGGSVGMWYLLIFAVAYPYASSIGGLFRMAAIR